MQYYKDKQAMHQRQIAESVDSPQASIEQAYASSAEDTAVRLRATIFRSSTPRVLTMMP